MYNEGDIYCIYRKAQAEHNNRGYRLPKDGSDYWTNKLAPQSREVLTRLAGYFNTKWTDISVERYFQAGFNVFKNLPYKQMLNKKIVKEYKRLDKISKLRDTTSKKSITDSAKFVLTTHKDFDIYCKIWYSAMIRQPVKDYIDNKITLCFLVFLNKYNYMKLTSEEKSMLPNLNGNYQRISNELDNIREFLNKLNRKGAMLGLN